VKAKHRCEVTGAGKIYAISLMAYVSLKGKGTAGEHSNEGKGMKMSARHICIQWTW
jgi:hypothetical protein